MWNTAYLAQINTWREYASEIKALTVHNKKRSQVWDGEELIPLAHGSFDNDIEVLTATLRRIIGDKPETKVENLHGF
jgi:hypothetical protein